MAQQVKNPLASAGDTRDAGSTPGSERSSGEGTGNPALYSCLEIPWTESSLAGCSPWDHGELDTTECTHLDTHISIDIFLKGSFYIKCSYKLSYSIIPHFKVYFCFSLLVD